MTVTSSGGVSSVSRATIGLGMLLMVAVVVGVELVGVEGRMA